MKTPRKTRLVAAALAVATGAAMAMSAAAPSQAVPEPVPHKVKMTKANKAELKKADALEKKLAGIKPAAKAKVNPKGTYAPTANYTARWSRADALKVNANATNTIPKIPESGTPITSDQEFVGDAWPLTNLNGDVVKFQGWNVLFSLTNSRDYPFHSPEAWPRIGYYFSKDAKNWTYGGDLFPEGASLGSRTWSGSTMITGKNDINAFYTAVGGTDEKPDHADGRQRAASGKGKIYADRDGVYFRGFHRQDHQILAEPDGVMYQTWGQYLQGQPKTQFPGFRDPWVFKDPKDKKTYMVFHGSKGGNPDKNTCAKEDIGLVPNGHEVPSDSKYFVGSVGIAVATNKDLSSWKLLPPLLSSNCVSQELERPHFIFKNGKYYLFVDEHKHKYAPGLTGPDGLYGFVGDSLRSDYKGLNGSSLVIANPDDANYQSFAWNITPNNLIQSFIQDRPGGEPGGSLAPTIKISLSGSTTRYVDELDYGYVPATTTKTVHPTP